jgi:hypothetical protein
MPMATQTHTTPTRRSALGFSAAALFAGLATPVLANTKHNPDAELIDICDQLVSLETETCLLSEHDVHAPDFGPNNVRYESLSDEKEPLMDLIPGCKPPTTPAGHAALGRLALTWFSRDHNGNITPSDFLEELTVKLVMGAAGDFVWPPRTGSCSTAHWAPPTSFREVAEHQAEREAWMAEIKAESQAKKLAEVAERLRRDSPTLLADDELRAQVGTSRRWLANTNAYNDELSAEMAKRGLEVA